MAKNSKSGTLSDKISELLTSVPKSFDPEDDVHEETAAKVVEHQDEEDFNTEVTTSKFRKQNIDLLEDVDRRYVGKKSSRKDLIDSDEWESDDADTSENESANMQDDEENSEEESQSDDEEDQSDNEEEGEGDDKSEVEENFEHMTADDNKVEKGKCVRTQLSLWESLLEMRIQLQKSLVSANKLPQTKVHQQFMEDNSKFRSTVKETESMLSSVLDKFLNLQNLLQKQYPETKSLNKVQEKPAEESDEEIPSDTEEEKSASEEEVTEEVPRKRRRKLEDFEEEISKRHEKYVAYRNSVIQKWYDKTKLLSGKHTAQHSVIDQINFVLSDKDKLIKRTQLKRSQYDIIGKKCDKEEEVCVGSEEGNEDDVKFKEVYDCEIFDDDDFYHQLLRELIEVKSADLTDPVQLGRQWIELQNLRSKMKRKIDTKATKGRKIRYAVHSKLVNFMAPMEENSTWTDDAKTELFNSLFGKNQIEGANL